MILLLVLLGLLVLLLVVGGLTWMSGLQWYATEGSGIIEAIPDAVETEPAAPAGMLVILSTRLAYTLGAQPDLNDPPTAAVVCDHLDQIIETIVASEADIVCVQEADFASQRTYDIDHLYYIAAALGWGYVARAVTWECRYLMWPWAPSWKQPLGRVRAGMGVISRYALIQNIRQRLPQTGVAPPFVRRLSPAPMVQMVDVQCGHTTLRLVHHDLGRGERAARPGSIAALASFTRDIYTRTSVLMGGFPDDTDLLSERFRMVPEASESAASKRPRGHWAHAFVGEELSGLETRVVTPAAGDGVVEPFLGLGLDSDSDSDQPPVTLHLRWALPLMGMNGQH